MVCFQLNSLYTGLCPLYEVYLIQKTFQSLVMLLSPGKSSIKNPNCWVHYTVVINIRLDKIKEHTRSTQMSFNKLITCLVILKSFIQHIWTAISQFIHPSYLGSLTKVAWMKSLATDDTPLNSSSGKLRQHCDMLQNVSCLFSPANGE